jgi:hypothetical protein
MFQALLLTNGCSTRHSRDMEHVKRIDLTSDDFKRLLRELEELIAHETVVGARRRDPPDNLSYVITTVVGIYLGSQALQYLAPGSVQNKLGRSLARLLEIFADKETGFALFMALSYPAVMRAWLSDEDFEQGAQRHERFVETLHLLKRDLPCSPGKPSKTRDLRAAVEHLVEFWMRATGKPFTQDWHRGCPLTPGTTLVYKVIEFIDPERLKELPTVTKRIVQEHRKSGNYYLKWLAANSGLSESELPRPG